MSKITFRANEDLVQQLERLDTSKSEVMRAALRSYLGGPQQSGGGKTTTLEKQTAQGVTVTINVSGADDLNLDPDPVTIEPEAAAESLLACPCGEDLQAEWAFCPDCGRRTPRAVVSDGV